MKWQWERTTSTFAFTTDACCAQVCCAVAGPRRFRQFFRGSTMPCEYCFAWQGHQGARGCMPSQCSCSPHPTSALVRRSLHYCTCHMYQKQEMWLLSCTVRAPFTVRAPLSRGVGDGCNFGIAGDRKRGRSRQHTTGVSFGARGDKVVASYHSDHAYCFDITHSSQEAAESALAYAATSAQPHHSRPVATNGHREVCSTSGRGDSACFTPCTLRTE